MATTAIATVTFAAFLLTAWMAIQRSSDTLIPIDVLVDSFMTDARIFIRLKPKADLLWTPILF